MWRERTLGPFFLSRPVGKKVVYYTQDGKAKGLTERVASMLGFIQVRVFSVDQCPNIYDPSLACETMATAGEIGV